MIATATEIGTEARAEAERETETGKELFRQMSDTQRRPKHRETATVTKQADRETQRQR